MPPKEPKAKKAKVCVAAGEPGPSQRLHSHRSLNSPLHLSANPHHLAPQTCYYLSNDTQETKAKSDKPKRPLSGYMKFAKETRPGIVTENPDLSFGEVGKELGARWRALSDEEKAEWKAK